MNKDEIFEAIAKNPVFQLATMDGNQPRVRGMLLYRADENGILFHTAASKDLYKQVQANPNVELCFNCNGTQIRITGKLKIVDDNDLKDEICNHPSRKFLAQWKEDGSFKNIYKDLIVFSLEHGSIVTWTMADNFAKKSPILF